VVAVCTPTQFHAEYALKAIDAGKHVFVERPLALRLEDCEALVSAANTTKCFVTLGFNFRYHHLILCAKKLIRSGRLGHINLIRSVACGNWKAGGPKKCSIIIIGSREMKKNDTTEKKPVASPSSIFVSVVVPVFNGGDDLDQCLGAVNRSDWPAFECIVVDDASSDQRTAEIARRHRARLEQLEQRRGPALARNAGVMKARGEVIFFTDADVLLHSDALGNHQIGNEEASTFWTGCGAIRKEVFMEMGGFSSDYERPSIEDIELGYRLREAGYRIRLLKTMFGTHLKHWKFLDMVRTDIFQRGVPWAALLWRYRSAPADLNLNWRARIATVSAALLPVTVLLVLFSAHAKAIVPTLALLLAALLCSWLTKDSDAEKSSNGWKSPLALSIGILMPLLTLAWLPDPWALLPLLLIAVIVWAQKDFYQLLSEQGGFGFAIAIVPFQLLFFMGCALSVPLGLLAFLRQR